MCMRIGFLTSLGMYTRIYRFMGPGRVNFSRGHISLIYIYTPLKLRFTLGVIAGQKILGRQSKNTFHGVVVVDAKKDETICYRIFSVYFTP